MVRKKNNAMAIVTHILGVLTYFAGPLVVYFSSKEDYVKKHAQAALNWQFSYLIYSAVSGVLALFVVGFFGLVALGVMNLIFCIIAAVRASEGELYNYPLTIKFFEV